MEQSIIRFRKFSSRNRVVHRGCVTPLRIYFFPPLCYRPRLCVHPMATSTPKNSNLLTRCLTVNHGLYPSAFISRFDEQKFSAFTIPSAIVSLSSHSTEPDQIPPERSTQGGREGEREGCRFFRNFLRSIDVIRCS